MKKSELFKEIYRTIRAVNNNIGNAYDDSVTRQDLEEEATDLRLAKSNVEYVKTALSWYSLRMSYVLTVSLTELLSKTFTIDSDVNLSEFDTVESLASDVEEAIQ